MIAVLFALVAASTQPDWRIITTQDLLNACNDQHEGRFVCQGYFNGTEATAISAFTVNLNSWTAPHLSWFACPPSHSLDEKIGVVDEYVRDHPLSEGTAADLMIIRAERKAWPCN